jgi:hypothetical protein
LYVILTVKPDGRHGVAANQLFTWRRLVAQGSLTAAPDTLALKGFWV